MRSRLSRIVCLCLVMLLIVGVMVYRLIQLQLVQGAEMTAQIDSDITRTYSVLASRGEILDRNGTVLAGNALGFSVQLDYYNWKKEGQNDTLTLLWSILSQADIPCKDELPLTQTFPLKYTFTTTEEGSGRRLAKFVEERGWNAVETLNPGRLFYLLCDHYGVDQELPLEQRRAIVGLRYYLDYKQFSAYNTPVVLASDVDIAAVAKISEKAAELSGVEIQVTDSRKYETTYAAHVLGHVGAISPSEYEERKEDGYLVNDTIGKEGMERALEDWLRGVDGTRAVEVDRYTGDVRNEYMLEEAQPGKNCFLTLDLELQARVEQALARTLAQIKEKGERAAKAGKTGSGEDAEGGAAVIIDVHTGEILAMASYPTYSIARYNADFAENNTNPMAPLLNRAVQSIYSPGSTFKMCTSLAALEEGIITPRTKIVDQGVYKRYESYQPRCWVYRDYGRTHGSITVSEALKYSCNYFFYEMGYQMGIGTIEEYAQKVGLGQKTGVELTEEKAGILAGPEERQERGGETWYPADTLMAAIGQSDHLFTPLQLANYVATLVNGGTRYQPHLLKNVKDYTNSEVLYEQQPVELNTVEMADSTLDAIKRGMKGVVTEDGTASSYFRNFPISVGGKTGSAQMIGHSASGVFVSFAPYDDPEIAVCVVGEYASSGGSLAPVAIAAYDEYFGLGLYDGQYARADGTVTQPPAAEEPIPAE